MKDVARSAVPHRLTAGIGGVIGTLAGIFLGVVVGVAGLAVVVGLAGQGLPPWRFENVPPQIETIVTLLLGLVSVGVVLMVAAFLGVAAAGPVLMVVWIASRRGVSKGRRRARGLRG